MDVVKQGPANLVSKKAYGTTMALSTLNNMLATNYLRRGHGIMAMPASRRAERLFGEGGSGRATLAAPGLKLEARLADYKPREDTCIRAFVRLLAARAEGDQEA